MQSLVPGWAKAPGKERLSPSPAESIRWAGKLSCYEEPSHTSQAS